MLVLSSVSLSSTNIIIICHQFVIELFCRINLLVNVIIWSLLNLFVNILNVSFVLRMSSINVNVILQAVNVINLSKIMSTLSSLYISFVIVVMIIVLLVKSFRSSSCFGHQCCQVGLVIHSLLSSLVRNPFIIVKFG